MISVGGTGHLEDQVDTDIQLIIKNITDACVCWCCLIIYNTAFVYFLK